MQVVCNKQATLRVVYVHEEGQEALEEVLRQVSKIHTDEEVFWTFDYFEKELASLQKRGLQACKGLEESHRDDEMPLCIVL